jgi:hypothetical protein
MGLPEGVKLLPGGLIRHRLTKSDLGYLGAYSTLLLLPLMAKGLLYLGYHEDLLPREKWDVYFLAVAGFVALMTLSSGFIIRFRNLYFSLLWVGLSVGVGTLNLSCAILPLGAFAYYHIVRLTFWRRYHVEFIPWSVASNYHPSYYDLEDRTGSALDLRYTKLYFRLGWLVLLICAWLTYKTW